MSYVRLFPAESFSELLVMLAIAIANQLESYRKYGGAFTIVDAKLDDDCDLVCAFGWECDWKDNNGEMHHASTVGSITIKFGKKNQNVTVRDSKLPIPMLFWDNYYTTTHICQITEELANRIFDRE